MLDVLRALRAKTRRTSTTLGIALRLVVIELLDLVGSGS